MTKSLNMRWLLIVGLMPVVVSWPFFPQPEPSPKPTSLLPFENCIDVDLLQFDELRESLRGRDKSREMDKCKTSFGLLDEDWQRLYLLESRVPNNSLLKTKLVRAFRLLITALYQAHGPTGDNETNANGSSNSDSVLLRPGIYPNVNQSTLEEDNEAAESDLMESNLPPPITNATHEQPALTSTEDSFKSKETHKQLSNDEPDEGQLLDGVDINTAVPQLSGEESLTAPVYDTKKDSNSDTNGEQGETQIEDAVHRGDIASYNSTAHNTDDYSKPVPTDDNVKPNKALVSETNTENDEISKQSSLKSDDGFIPNDPSETTLDYKNVPVLPNENSEEFVVQLTNIYGDDMTTQSSDLSNESSYHENQPPENNNADQINLDSRHLDNNYDPLQVSNNTLDDSQPPYDTEMGPDEIIYSSTPETTTTSKEYTDISATTNLPSIPPDPLDPSKQWSDSDIGYDNLFSSSNSPSENDLTTIISVFYTTTTNTVKYNVDDSQSDLTDVTNEIFTTTDRDFSTTSLTDTPSSLYETQKVDNLGYKSSSNYPEITTSIPVNTFKSSEIPHDEESPESKDSDIDIPSDSSTFDSPFERTTSTIFQWKSETEDSTFPNHSTYDELSTTSEHTTLSNLNQLSTHLDEDDKDIFPETKEIPDNEAYTFTDYKAPITTTTVQPTKESFKTFSVVFPKDNENFVPIIPANELYIYLPNRRPFRLGLPVATTVNCKNNNNCIRVQNIEFKDSEDGSENVINRLQGSRERISKFNKKVYPEHSDSDDDYWRYKMNNLRKKSINR